MEQLRWTSFIVLSTVIAIVMQLTINSVIAQAPNTSLAQNNSTLRIVDLKNNTISIIDPNTNQIINVTNFTGSATSREILTPEKTTINETLTTNAGNATTNENLTAKFNVLQGK
jgi:hypothetical protein